MVHQSVSVTYSWCMISIQSDLKLCRWSQSPHNRLFTGFICCLPGGASQISSPQTPGSFSLALQLTWQRKLSDIRTAVFHLCVNGGMQHLHLTLKKGIRAYLTDGCQIEAALLQTILYFRASKHTTVCVSSVVDAGKETIIPS